MTAPVCARQRIKQLDRQGLSHKEISRKLGVSRTTVVRYANHGDYSPRPSNAVRPGSAQADFGQAGAVVAGVERVAHSMAVSFPYSNMRGLATMY